METFDQLEKIINQNSEWNMYIEQKRKKHTELDPYVRTLKSFTGLEPKYLRKKNLFKTRQIF